MNFSVLSNLKKLLAAFKDFTPSAIPDILRTVAELFDSGKDIWDAFVKPTPVGSAPHAGLSDEELTDEVGSIVLVAGDGTAHFNPIWVPLIVELLKRLFDKIKK